VRRAKIIPSRGRVCRLATPLAVAVLGLTGCSYLGIGHASATGSAGNTDTCTAKVTAAHRYLGLAAQAGDSAADGAASFGKLVGQSPNLVSYYVSFGDSFNATETCAIARTGALPVIQLDPYHISIPKIADGFYDQYLSNYAAAVKKFGAPVAISFAHEMNGTWYTWGPPGIGSIGVTSPAQDVAAWKEIHNVFQAAGATNVIWLWTPNVWYSQSPPLSQYYPGNSYVTWVGVDGYFWHVGDTFQSVFGQTLQMLAAFTKKPIIIAETGVTNQAGTGLQVDSLFRGVESTPNILGFVYFDAKGTDNWMLEDNPRGLAAFRSQVPGYGLSSHS
jgi:mannan endo-1,4-beta-mannosidase